MARSWIGLGPRTHPLIVLRVTTPKMDQACWGRLQLLLTAVENTNTIGKIELLIRPVSRWQWFAAVLEWLLFFFSPPQTQKRLSLLGSWLKKKVVKLIDGEPTLYRKLAQTKPTYRPRTDNLDISNEVNKKTLFPARFPSRMDWNVDDRRSLWEVLIQT